jgi:hypothetical protein
MHSQSFEFSKDIDGASVLNYHSNVDGQAINLSIDVDGMEDIEIENLINDLMNQDPEQQIEAPKPDYDQDDRDTVG